VSRQAVCSVVAILVTKLTRSAVVSFSERRLKALRCHSYNNCSSSFLCKMLLPQRVFQNSTRFLKLRCKRLVQPLRAKVFFLRAKKKCRRKSITVHPCQPRRVHKKVEARKHNKCILHSLLFSELERTRPSSSVNTNSALHKLTALLFTLQIF